MKAVSSQAGDDTLKEVYLSFSEVEKYMEAHGRKEPPVISA